MHFFNNHLVRIHKTSHVNSKIGQKWECSQQCLPSITLLPFSQNLNKKGKKKNEKKQKNKKNEQS